MNSKSSVVTYITLLLVAAFYAIGLLYPAYWNWGVFLLPGLLYVQIAILVLVLMLALIPAISISLYDKLTSVLNELSVSLRKLPIIIRGIMWIAIPFAALYLLRIDVHIYGDAQNLMGSIVSGEISSPFYNRIGMLMQIIAKTLGIAGGTREAAANYVAMISILAGIVFLYFTWKTIGMLLKSTGHAVIAYLAVITSGLIIIFAGYIETYSVIIAWLAVYIFYSIKILRGQGRLWILIILFLIGIFWHFWFIAFLPSLIYILHRHLNAFSKAFVWISGAVFIIGVYVLGQLIRRGDFPLTIPFLPTDKTNYWLFAPEHLIDLFNQLIMVGPVLGLLGLVFLIIGKNVKLDDYQRFLAWAAIPSLLIAFMIDPHLGAARDWDLLSIFAAPLLILGIFVFQNNKKPGLKYLLYTIIIFNLIHTGSALKVNKNESYAVDRIVDITYGDPHYGSEYYDGIRNRQFSVILSNVYGRNEDAIRFMERRRNPESDDILAIANFYYNIEDFQKAARYYGILTKSEDLSPLHQFCYGRSELFSRRPDSAINILKPVIQDSTFFDLYFHIGAGYLLTMKPDSAVKFFDKGLSISQNPVSDLEIVLRFVSSTRSPLLMAHFQKRLFFMFPDSLPVRNRLIQLYEQAQMPDSAEFYRNYKPR